jgi:hypothetical protein
VDLEVPRSSRGGGTRTNSLMYKAIFDWRASDAAAARQSRFHLGSKIRSCCSFPSARSEPELGDTGFSKAAHPQSPARRPPRQSRHRDRPDRRAVQGALSAMKAERLVTRNLRRWRLTKEGERMAQEGEPAPKTIGPTAGQRSAKREGPKSGPRRTMQQPETLIFSCWPVARPVLWPGGPRSVWRWPGPNGRHVCPPRASKPNHLGQSLPSAPHKGQGTGRHQTGSRRSCRANRRRGA